MLIDVRELLLQQIKARYGASLRAVFLVGSQARGDAKPFSDINLLVLTEDRSELTCLFPRGELAVLDTQTLESFLANLYAPVAQEVIDWWLVAGNVQTAVPWLDQADILSVAKRILPERRPLLDLHSRILWDGQIAELLEWQGQLQVIPAFTTEHFLALSRFAERAERALLLYHGDILDRWDVARLQRPKSFLADWATVWCLGAEPRQVDMATTADAMVQLVKGLWQSGQSRLAHTFSQAELAARQEILDRVPGRVGTWRMPSTDLIQPELIDTCLQVLWGAVKCLLQRDPVRLLRQANSLWLQFEQAGLLPIPEVLELLSIARIPSASNLENARAAAARIAEGLKNINQAPSIVPHPNQKRL